MDAVTFARGDRVLFDGVPFVVGTIKPHKRGTHVELLRESDNRLLDLTKVEEWLDRIEVA